MGWVKDHQYPFVLDLIKLLEFAHSKGYITTLGEVQRMIEMQEIYVTTGRSKTMNSMHLKKCAADISFFKFNVLTGAWELVTSKAILQEIGDFWESLDPRNQWGGNWKSFKDIPHFERRF